MLWCVYPLIDAAIPESEMSNSEIGKRAAATMFDFGLESKVPDFESDPTSRRMLRDFRIAEICGELRQPILEIGRTFSKPNFGEMVSSLLLDSIPRELIDAHRVFS